MQSARGIFISFALAWLVVAGGLIGSIAGAQAAAGPGSWTICAPSGAAEQDGGTQAAHKGQACCTTLCGSAILVSPSAAMLRISAVAVAPQTASTPAASFLPPAGLGTQPPRAPPVNA